MRKRFVSIVCYVPCVVRSCCNDYWHSWEMFMVGRGRCTIFFSNDLDCIRRKLTANKRPTEHNNSLITNRIESVVALSLFKSDNVNSLRLNCQRSEHCKDIAYIFLMTMAQTSCKRMQTVWPIRQPQTATAYLLFTLFTGIPNFNSVVIW